MADTLKDIVNQGFTSGHIIVVGDLMLDKYMQGQVRRVSPEAPVPIIQLEEEKFVPGGAGNVALNLQRLGVTVSLIGLIGNDSNGTTIKRMLNEENISSDYLISSSMKPTITKTRIVGKKQQIARIDRENKSSISDDMEAHLIENVLSILSAGSIDAIVISDYAKGLITNTGCQSIIRLANEKDIPVIVDPKEENFTKYDHSTVLMPNEDELARACGESWEDKAEFKKAARQLYETLNVEYFVITRGAKGISLITENNSYDFSTKAREVYDVSGAGDTVAAVLAAGYTTGLSIEKSIELANMAAGYVVRKRGTYAISRDELNGTVRRHRQGSQKWISLPELKNLAADWKNHHQTVVFTNGCFDIVHRGHIHLLQEAKREGDKLIVALNTDKSVQQLKGMDRPFNSLDDRVSVLEAFSAVDAIIDFKGETPLRLIEEIKPDVLVKGDDYKEEDIVGAGSVKKEGGKVVRVPLVEGKSTTGLIKQISNNHSND